MIFENEINLFDPNAIANEFHAQSTQINVVQGKISAMISDSQISELQNGEKNMYDRLVSAEADISGITTQVSELRQTDGELESQISTIRQTANEISLDVSSVKNNYAQKAQIILAINNTTQQSETVIKAEHISLAGKTIDLTSDNIAINSTNFKVDRYGNITAKSGTFSGKLDAASGTFNGVLRSVKGNEWIKIDESIISGGYSNAEHGMLDLSSQYADGTYKVILENKVSDIILKVPTGKELFRQEGNGAKYPIVVSGNANNAGEYIKRIEYDSDDAYDPDALWIKITTSRGRDKYVKLTGEPEEELAPAGYDGTVTINGVRMEFDDGRLMRAYNV